MLHADVHSLIEGYFWRIENKHTTTNYLENL
jgi:hypothetical protein